MPYRVICSDETGIMSLVYFNIRGPYLRQMLSVGSQKVVSGKIEEYKDSFQITHPHHIASLEDIDSVKTIETIYPLTSGLTSKSLRKAINTTLSQTSSLPEWLDDKLMTDRNWYPWKKSLDELHNPSEALEINQSPYLERLAFDELLSHQLTIRLIKQKINKDLNWKPSVDFKQGLSLTIDWYLNNKNWLKNVTSGEYRNYYKKQYSG